MIGIVYHSFLIGNWKEVVTGQLKRLKDSGLYDKSDIIWFTVNLNGNDESVFDEIVKEYSKASIEYNVDNHAEYPGIRKVKELGDSHDDIKILYFHSKGVSNDYVVSHTKVRSETKYRNVNSWKECLEYFVIDKWEDCIEKLNEYDNVGVTCNSNWFWGNFWWSQSSHIKKCSEVGIWGRWDYEAWLNRGIHSPKNYEYYKFTYNPYLTYFEPDWYKNPSKLKGGKITLHKALYGTAEFQIDEGYASTELGITTDVTEVIDKKLEEQEYKRLFFRIDNDTMGGDPIYGFKKVLTIDFSLDIEPNKIYTVGIGEDQQLDLNFN